MKISKLSLIPLATAVALACAGSVSAAPVIAINPDGTGFAANGVCNTANCFYASNLTINTDTGEDVGPQTVGSTHTFSTQAAVGSTSDNGAITTPSLLNHNSPGGFELTKQIQFNDILNSISVDPITGAVTNQFGFTSVQPQATNLTIFLDTLGDGTQAIRSGAGGASCYGNGLGVAGSPCNAGNDGVVILTAKLIADSSSFTASSPGTGLGSFHLTFQITSGSNQYISLANLGNNTIFSEDYTGTIVQPANEANLGFPPPVQMWNGTAFGNTDNSNAFKVDGSETFAVVPAPTTVALLGLGLAILSFTSRKRSQS